MSDPRKDMQLLYDVEYGVQRELVMRLVGVCIGAGLIHLYEGWYSPFVWCAGYLLTHAVHYRYITTHMERTTRRDLVVAGSLYLLVVVAFLWLPAYFATQHDPVMIYIGGVLMTSTMIYQIRRADRILWLNWAQILIFAALVTTILISHMDHFNGMLAKVGAVLVTFAAFVYIILAMLYARSSRLAMEEAAERLAQDQKMSAIGRLAGGVAHDFNNMLTVVKGNLELYHLMDDPAERDAAVAEAQLAAQRAEEVVQHLMVYARKAPTRVRDLDANEAVASVMTLTRTMIPARIAREFAPCAGRVPISVDESQLTTALLNLVKNAVDAMPEAGKLRISTAVETLTAPLSLHGHVLPEGTYATVTVSDTGTGIPEPNLSRVAEPFFTTKPPGQGTGLGLSMVAGFVQGAGGGLRIVTSAKGTAVSLLFPAPALEPAKTGGRRRYRLDAGTVVTVENA